MTKAELEAYLEELETALSEAFNALEEGDLNEGKDILAKYLDDEEE
jgi:hypothetical protein